MVSIKRFESKITFHVILKFSDAMVTLILLSLITSVQEPFNRFFDRRGTPLVLFEQLVLGLHVRKLNNIEHQAIKDL